MSHLEVKNWDEFQHYKKRNPPWIKLHNTLLNNYEFTCLQDASKAHLILIWLLASQTENQIPCNPDWVQKRLHLDEKPDLKFFVEQGFLRCADKTLANCKQCAINLSLLDRGETETEIPNQGEVSSNTSTTIYAVDPSEIAGAF